MASPRGSDRGLNDWENPRVTSINRCEAHVPLRAHASSEEALSFWRSDLERVKELAEQISAHCAVGQTIDENEYCLSNSFADLLPKRGYEPASPHDENQEEKNLH